MLLPRFLLGDYYETWYYRIPTRTPRSTNPREKPMLLVPMPICWHYLGFLHVEDVGDRPRDCPTTCSMGRANKLTNRPIMSSGEFLVFWMGSWIGSRFDKSCNTIGTACWKCILRSGRNIQIKVCLSSGKLFTFQRRTAPFVYKGNEQLNNYLIHFVDSEP